jgi:hypothetical protein
MRDLFHNGWLCQLEAERPLPGHCRQSVPSGSAGRTARPSQYMQIILYEPLPPIYFGLDGAEGQPSMILPVAWLTFLLGKLALTACRLARRYSKAIYRGTVPVAASWQ